MSEEFHSNDMLEKLFERVVKEIGGPLVDAHIVAEAGGFTIESDGMLTGHNDDMIALGFVQSGLIGVRPDIEEHDGEEPRGEWVIFKDQEHAWLTTVLLEKDAVRMLIRDLQSILNEDNKI